MLSVVINMEPELSDPMSLDTKDEVYVLPCSYITLK